MCPLDTGGNLTEFHTIKIGVITMLQGLGFLWVPFLIATAVSGGSSFGMAWMTGNRIKNGQKLASSNWANEAEGYLQENLNAWLALTPTQKTKALQNEAINVFHYWWGQMVEKCSTLGDAGARCINERKRGGVNSWGKDWWELYLDPIANDTTVEDQTNTGGGGGNAPTTTVVNTNGSTSVNPTPTNPSTNMPVIDGMGISPYAVLAGLAVAYYLVSPSSGRRG